jgi:phosphate transport system permease protein
MSFSWLLLVLVILAAISFVLGRRRSVGLVGGRAKELHSLPGYYGYYAALWCAVPAIVVAALWVVVEPLVVRELVLGSIPADQMPQEAARVSLLYTEISNLATGNITGTEITPAIERAAAYFNELHAASAWLVSALALVIAAGGLAFGLRRIQPRLRARNAVERAVMVVLILSSSIAIFTTAGIVLSLLFESLRFFAKVPLTEFLFGLKWSPQTALRADQVGSSGAFGAIPLIGGTLLITFIAMCVSVPVGLFSAIYLSEFSNQRIRGAVKPLLEILAGVPTVVYGFFAALSVAPFLRDTGGVLGLDVASESALAAGLVMGVMIIPFVSSLSDDVINAVPQSLRDGAYALGATRAETVTNVILPAALPGIVGAVLLAISRAIGETMIVVMAAGLAANLTINPLEAVTTVTVQIVTLLIGDQEFDSAKTLSAFALGLLLFLITLTLNVIALRVVRKYREKYD